MTLAGVLAAEAFDRIVLLENFTTSDCINCPRGHDDITNAFKRENRFIWVCHHAGYTAVNDPFQIKESVEYTWFYPQGMMFAPAFMMNRMDLTKVIPDLVSQHDPVISVTQTMVSQSAKKLLSEPAHTTVGIEGKYDSASRLLDLKISGCKDSEFNLDNPVVNVFLTESGLIGYQQGKGYRYSHEHVMRAVLTPVWGEPIVFSGDDWSYEVSYVLPDEWVADNMEIVAFVSNYDPDDKTNCGVENAISSPVLAEINGIKDIAEEIETRYFNIQGMELSSRPDNGVYIRQRIFSDGTVTSTLCR